MRFAGLCAILLAFVATRCKGSDDEGDVGTFDTFADTSVDALGDVADDAPVVTDVAELPGAVSRTVMVNAAAGGTVALGDGTRLDIPAGALAADTAITMRRADAEPRPAMPGSVLAGLKLEPEGLVFTTPARITIPFEGITVPTDEVALVMTSTLNEIRDVGGERTATEPLVATVSTTQVTADLPHFSALHVLWVPRLFAAFETPGRYLRTGDILYALTNGVNHLEATMIPIHVGLFVNDADHDGTLESTLPTSGCNPPMNGVAEGPYDGDCGFRSLKGQHVFLGARRPNRSVTVAQGIAAVAGARRFLGTSYGIVALPTTVVEGTGMSCVQLVEDAWEEAGVNISYAPDQLNTPSYQYGNTVPVESIVVDVAGGPVRLPIVVAVRTGIITFAAAKSGVNVTVDVDDGELFLENRFRLEEPQHTPLPSGTGPQAIKDLVFEPAEDDLGKNYTFTVTINVPSNGQGTTLKMRIELGACGNGNLEGSEECEQVSPNTCTGGARCNSACKCSLCGNGVLEGGESCDRTASDPGGPTFGCSLDTACQDDCTCGAAVCGNSRTEPGEDCDSDSLNCTGPTPWCNGVCECAASEVCGNSVLDQGEQCDYRLGPGECGTSRNLAGYLAQCTERTCRCACPTYTTTDCANDGGVVHKCVEGTHCEPAWGHCAQTTCPPNSSFDSSQRRCVCDPGFNRGALDNCRGVAGSGASFLVECYNE